MGKIKDTLLALGTLGMILGVGVLLILGFGAFVIGVKWLWAQIPFGIAGFFLGAVILAITFYFSRQIFPERKINLSWHYLLELGMLEVIGYLFGFVMIFISLLWFVLPAPVFRVLPSFGQVLPFSLLAVFLTYGVGGCLTAGILAFRVYIWGSFFYIACGLVGFWVVNAPVWSYTEGIPNDYYILGKLIFIFLAFLQIIYITFFHILPAIKQYRDEKFSEKVNNVEKKTG